ncbi:MAG: hypothetical protein IOB85_13525 [Methylobacterium sp.]|nr:hypothetical protein [Methylobacterium sp.]MCA3658403.1 hypothetical protein [Methylobacterium sp.]MCA3662906.1 hypothetical protein [Methylobacterium sp.]MCA3668922.1 hypothetical protein [Methylobacterium sp.]MCA3671336.1 hypothetical protein [Methylobacterium sp.]
MECAQLGPRKGGNKHRFQHGRPASTPEETADDDHDHPAEHRREEARDDRSANPDAQGPEDPVADKRTDKANDEVAEDATRAADDFRGKPPRDEAEQQGPQKRVAEHEKPFAQRTMPPRAEIAVLPIAPPKLCPPPTICTRAGSPNARALLI